MENFLPQTYIALGTISAAIIGLFSIFLSKEIKISELRQNWIDSLRLEISELISISVEVSILFNNILDKSPDNFDDAIKMYAPKLKDIQKNITLIRLRLNPTEHTNLLKKIDDFEKFIKIFRYKDVANFDKKIEEITSESIIVLKEEWVVVKNGGSTFKFLSLCFKLIILIGLVFLIVA